MAHDDLKQFLNFIDARLNPGSASPAQNEPSPQSSPDAAATDPNHVRSVQKQAEHDLKRIFKLEHFYPEQWETIQQLLNGKRLLLIQKTGFGKSLCYQFPAAQLSGVTVVFSPLIALMRDQIKYLKALDIAAECVNSEQAQDVNAAILQRAIRGNLKLLYIAPERQENDEWLEAVKQIPLAMVVIDEAHCISVWGHDFRPAYRRIVNVVRLLPENFPVLATTATATDRVAQDIMAQMGGKITLIRGNLLRPNFRLRVVTVESEDAKMIWLAEFLQKQPGNGLIYTGTRVNTEIYAAWLQFVGIAAMHYNAGLEAETRKDIEHGLLTNRWKCIVSTNALGMGIDKPDIRFLIHTQMPQSPIHYYQEIGRAGRDGQPTEVILLYAPDDHELPEYFIENSRPALEKYQRVIAILKKEPLGEQELVRRTNLTQTQVRVIRADLLDQGIIHQVNYGKSKVYEYHFGATALNPEPFEQLRQFKRAELEQMFAYMRLSTCRMQFLCHYLGDTTAGQCGQCDNDAGHKHVFQPSQNWQTRLQAFKDDHFPILEVELQSANLVNGVAAGYYGFSNLGAVIHRCKYERGGDFPDHLLTQTLRAFRHHYGNHVFDLVVYVPPTESGDLVKNFALKIAKALNVKISHHLQKRRPTQPQKVFQNPLTKRDNVHDAFVYQPEHEVVGKRLLVVDDIFDTGATMKEIGRLLTKSGAKTIAPLVIAKTISGDMP